jgi:hypothetical protein
MATAEEQLQNSQKLEAIYTRINQLRQRETQFANDTSAAGQAQLQTIRAQLVVERNILNVEQDRLANQSGLTKELASFAKSYAKLSSTVKAQLQTQSSVNTQTSIYKSLGEEIAKSKAREANLTGEALEHEQERGALITEVNSSLLSQAKATAKAIDDAKGLTEFDKMRRELKETMLHLSDQEKQKLEDAINIGLKRNFNITLEKYNEILISQNYKCCICNNYETSYRNEVLSVDHCHNTGKIRGLLCNTCNRALGLFKDNVELLTNAIKYLNNNEKK